MGVVRIFRCVFRQLRFQVLHADRPDTDILVVFVAVLHGGVFRNLAAVIITVSVDECLQLCLGQVAAAGVLLFHVLVAVHVEIILCDGSSAEVHGVRPVYIKLVISGAYRRDILGFARHTQGGNVVGIAPAGRPAQFIAGCNSDLIIPAAGEARNGGPMAISAIRIGDGDIAVNIYGVAVVIAAGFRLSGGEQGAVVHRVYMHPVFRDRRAVFFRITPGHVQLILFQRLLICRGLDLRNRARVIHGHGSGRAVRLAGIAFSHAVDGNDPEIVHAAVDQTGDIGIELPVRVRYGGRLHVYSLFQVAGGIAPVCGGVYLHLVGEIRGFIMVLPGRVPADTDIAVEWCAAGADAAFRGDVLGCCGLVIYTDLGRLAGGAAAGGVHGNHGEGVFTASGQTRDVICIEPARIGERAYSQGAAGTVCALLALALVAGGVTSPVDDIAGNGGAVCDRGVPPDLGGGCARGGCGNIRGGAGHRVGLGRDRVGILTFARVGGTGAGVFRAVICAHHVGVRFIIPKAGDGGGGAGYSGLEGIAAAALLIHPVVGDGFAAVLGGGCEGRPVQG